MITKFISLLFLLIPFYTNAQKQGNIWYFGDHAGLDFNNNPPLSLLNGQTDFPLPNHWNEGCSSISDSSGNLLFYTNGMKVWNKEQQVMPNGNNLLGHSSSTQSTIIIPQPGNEQYFYVFTTDAEENNFQNGLRYNVVDICHDNGLGDIMPSEKNIKLLDAAGERLICITHSNGIDYWIISHKFNSDAFYSFRLTSTGIIDTIISHTGTVDNLGWGQTVASPNGLKIAYAKPGANSGFTLLLDFNPSTGIVSNEQTLNTLNTEYGAAFSPDNSKLYFSTTGHGEIYQYNLNAGNFAAVLASKTHIIQNGPDSWREMQLAPDGKIYIARAGKTYLSIIEYPNNLYPTCNYIDSAIYLGGQYSSWGLPNYITGYKYHNNVPPSECDICINFPEAKFNYTTDSLAAYLHDVSGGSSPNNWFWDFGDGNTSTQQNPMHLYDTSGLYFVTFVACDNWCCDTITDTVRVNAQVIGGVDNLNMTNNNVILYQNIPNPFGEETTINFYLPETVKTAKMIFYDNMGKVIKEVMISQKGSDSLIVRSSELSTGVYSYSLVVDDKVAGTKMMVKNK